MADDSSSSQTGTIVWQTSMSISDSGTTPPIEDSFVSDRWTETQYHQGLIKYTQYIDVGCVNDGSSTSISNVEKVDFGWLEEPKFLCFSNITPENHEPTSIFIGVENEEVQKNFSGDSSEMGKPVWFVGQLTEEEFSSNSINYGIPQSLSYAFASSVANNCDCQMTLEVPPGMTIGPIVIPDGVTFWAYMENTGVFIDSSSSSRDYGAILLTEAYDS